MTKLRRIARGAADGAIVVGGRYPARCVPPHLRRIVPYGQPAPGVPLLLPWLRP